MFSSRASTIIRTRAVVAPRSRFLHASPVARKTVTEKVTEVADKVNKSVGKTLAGAIDKGEKATDAAKETVGKSHCFGFCYLAYTDSPYTASATKDTANEAKETTEQVKHKARHAEAGAREAKRDFAKEVRK